ncbi:sugar transferase [Candidatus Thioglobus sp.]|nr:sugar transferase [Candidatus Thioglobus sp.]
MASKENGGLSPANIIVKMTFDFTFAIIGLLLTGWIILIAWIVSSIETKSNGFFIQKRIGQRGKLFNIFKIKTMQDEKKSYKNITTSSDVRITLSGAIFRSLKIDELPQLWNILLGQMSFVGPRPDVPGYADQLFSDDKIILSVKPGITGPAQLKYKSEENTLSRQDDPIKYNDEVIWPDKVKINVGYVKNYSFFRDMKYIFKTITGLNVKF